MTSNRLLVADTQHHISEHTANDFKPNTGEPKICKSRSLFLKRR